MANDTKMEDSTSATAAVEKKDDTEAGKEENAEAQDNVQATESEELDPDAVTLAARAFRSWLHSVLLSSV